MAQFRAREGTGAKALMFLIYVSARASEVTGATWSEIDLATATWTIPADRMKARRPHAVPLAGVVALFESLRARMAIRWSSSVRLKDCRSATTF